jgi:formiminoglutamase
MSYENPGDDLNIAAFLSPVDLGNGEEQAYKHGQVGTEIDAYTSRFPDVTAADIIFVGCGEQRGAGYMNESGAPNAIRRDRCEAGGCRKYQDG